MVTTMETVIFGASRQGRVVLEVLRAQGQHPILGFLDDDTSKHDVLVDGLPVLGGMEWAAANAPTTLPKKARRSTRPRARNYAPQGTVDFAAATGSRRLAAIVAIGGNDARTDIAKWLRALGFDLINAIHPSAVIQGNISLGTGNLICAGAVLITGTRVEDDVVINTGSTIDHDSLLEIGAQVASGVTTSGCVTIRRGAFVGVGAILGPGVTVGERAIVGAGSLVLQDVPPGMLAYGAPCRVVREISDPVDWGRILAGDPALPAQPMEPDSERSDR
jgi:sugar O-acyltransferase (sialic acid O-acetyltransferase NeuD family)